MSMITPQTINQEMEKRLKATELNFTLPSKWYNMVLFSLTSASLLGIGLTANEFADLITKLEEEKQLNLFEFATLNNHRESRTYKDFEHFCCSFQDFVQTQIEFSQYEVLWNEQVNPMKESLMGEMITNQNGSKNGMRAIPE